MLTPYEKSLLLKVRDMIHKERNTVLSIRVQDALADAFRALSKPLDQDDSEVRRMFLKATEGDT